MNHLVTHVTCGILWNSFKTNWYMFTCVYIYISMLLLLHACIDLQSSLVSKKFSKPCSGWAMIKTGPPLGPLQSMSSATTWMSLTMSTFAQSAPTGGQAQNNTKRVPFWSSLTLTIKIIPYMFSPSSTLSAKRSSPPVLGVLLDLKFLLPRFLQWMDLHRPITIP